MSALVTRSQKFAFLASRGADVELASPLDLEDGLVVSPTVPFEVPKHWHSYPGDDAVKEVQRSNLFLLARRSYESTDNDLESLAIWREVYRLFFGLYVATPGYFSLSGRVIGGYFDDSAYTYRVSPVEPMYHSPGTPKHWRVCRPHLLVAKKIADALLATRGLGEFERLNRVNFAMFEALSTQYMTTRLQQSVRVLEGLVFPPESKSTGPIFSDRAQLFVGNTHHELLKNLYAMRGKVEHLHGPLAAVAEVRPDLEPAERMLHMAFACFAAENLAKACLVRVYTRPRLWPHFASDHALSVFWSRPSKRAMWGPPIDFEMILRSFDRNAAGSDLEQAERENAPNQNADDLVRAWKKPK